MDQICDGCGQPPYGRPDGKTATTTMIPLKVCRRCRRARYHNVDCQKRHYHIHKGVCRRFFAANKNTVVAAKPWFRIETLDPIRGKGVLANTDLPRRTVLPLSPASSTNNHPLLPLLNPIVPPVLFAKYRTSHCSVCFAKTTNNNNNVYFSDDGHKKWVLLCEGCHHESTRTTTTIDWLNTERQAVQRLLQQIPAGSPVTLFPTAVLVYRLLVKTNGSQDINLSHFVGHDDIDDESEANNNESQRAHGMATVFLVRQLLVDQTVSARSILHVLNQINYNAFTITNGDDEALGIGLYSSPAFCFNHSCRPNVVQSFVFGDCLPPRLQLTTSRDVTENDELTISYLDHVETRSVEDRRSFLKQQYRFDCACLRCREES